QGSRMSGRSPEVGPPSRFTFHASRREASMDAREATDLCFKPATELAALIRGKALSPVELTEAVLARIDRLNPLLNAYRTLTAADARIAARTAEESVMRGDELGPLHGVPLSVKDLQFTKGIRTARGSKLYEDYVPDEDAP